VNLKAARSNKITAPASFSRVTADKHMCIQMPMRTMPGCPCAEDALHAKNVSPERGNTDSCLVCGRKSRRFSVTRSLQYFRWRYDHGLRRNTHRRGVARHHHNKNLRTCSKTYHCSPAERIGGNQDGVYVIRCKEGPVVITR
jgi:hypothetical protein